MRPRGLVGTIYAMARPRRPIREADAVRLAADAMRGSVASRARRIASAVAVEAMADVDLPEGDQIIGMLRKLGTSPVTVLATDPDINTAVLVVDERVRMLCARGGRRLPEGAWPDDDKATLAAVTATLAERYRRLLSLQK